ncbi:MAG TPA: SDR family oxidoreductase, partial [Thermoleophilaceae bacterium]|nr:SDR family oxidoreductase [Thermoleophilaceae bacterium]
AVVTGGSSGIGEGIALAFANEGAQVTVCGRDEQRTAATRAAIEAAGGVAHAALGDVSDPDEVTRIVDVAAAAMGGIDVLVNCAGIGELDGWVPVHEHSQTAWDRTLAVNLTGPFLMSKAVLPHMLAAGGGALLHISSVCSITVWAGDSAYSVSKAGLNMLSDHIAVEYGDKGIRSNTLLPGEILTPLHESAASASPDAREWERQVLAKHPVARFGTVDEVAEAAVFLCSDESRFLTGANVPIDGAYSRV